MTALELLEAIGQAQDAYIQEALAPRESAAPAPRLRLKRALLIAAVIAMALLLVGCAVVYVLNLQDMKIAEHTYSQTAYTTPDGETVPATEWTEMVFSLQGYNNSPAQMALQEWLEYLDSYDPDHSLLNANNRNESGLPDNYYINYGCYTWEMADHLNALLAKYHLKALGTNNYCQRWQYQILFDALQLNSLHREDANAEVTYLGGYFTPEGTFKADLKLALTDAGPQWSQEVGADFRYALTDSLYPAAGGVKNIAAVEQYHHTLTDGTELLLALNGDAAWIICDKGNAFITINLYQLSDHEGEPFTKDVLMQFADVFDFSIVPQAADMANVEQLFAQSVEPYNPAVHGYYIGFSIDPDGTWHPPEGYSGSIASYLTYVQKNAEPENQYYALMDLDGDGVDEILLGNAHGQLYEMADMQNGEVTVRFVTYVCEGNILERYCEDDYEDGSIRHTYSTSSDFIAELRYLPASGQWVSLTQESEQRITAAEARQLMASYPRIELDMKPISEYS